MKENVWNDPEYKTLVDELSKLNQSRKRLSSEFMKKTDIPAIAELDKVIKEVRKSGRK